MITHHTRKTLIGSTRSNEEHANGDAEYWDEEDEGREDEEEEEEEKHDEDKRDDDEEEEEDTEVEEEIYTEKAKAAALQGTPTEAKLPATASAAASIPKSSISHHYIGSPREESGGKRQVLRKIERAPKIKLFRKQNHNLPLVDE